MAGNGRNQRRGLLEVLEFARTEENKVVTNIEGRNTIVGAISFGIEKRVRNAVRRSMRGSGVDYVELISGDYFIYDVTAKMPALCCKVKGCKERARVLESRLIFVYDEEDQEYQLDEFSPEVKKILQATRKRAVICEDDMLKAQIRGETLDVYERIHHTGVPAPVSRLKHPYTVVGGNLLKTNFGITRRSPKVSGKKGTVTKLFERKEK